MGGIYRIRNVINNKIYIGSAFNFKVREKRHFNQLRKGKHHSVLLQRAFDKYGEENFVFEIVYEAKEEELNKEDLLKLEQKYLDELKPFAPIGYNVSRKATNCVLYGEENGMWGKRGKDNPNYGRKDKPEVFEIKSKAQKGRKVSEETKKKLSQIAKERYKTEKSPFYGKHWDEENKKRLSKQHNKAVIQMDKETLEIIAEFESGLKAQEATGISNDCISNACRGKTKTAGGYKWKFKE